jgi:uncharacterized membrane protein (DUF485 family)
VSGCGGVVVQKIDRLTVYFGIVPIVWYLLFFILLTFMSSQMSFNIVESGIKRPNPNPEILVNIQLTTSTSNLVS